MRKNSASNEADIRKELIDFSSFVTNTGGHPSFHFEWKDPKQKNGEKIPKKLRSKRRFIGIPNREMELLHKSFGEYLRERIDSMGKEGRVLINLPSSTGCVIDSNHFINASKHLNGKFFYITDFSHAYPSLNLRRLTLLLLFILRRERYPDYTLLTFARNELAHFALEGDPNFERAYGFVKFAFGGMHGVGLAVGGNLSPYLLNLYCEVFLDSRIRYYCARKKIHLDPKTKLTYTRYVDDLVFTRGIIFSDDTKREIRRIIEDAGFKENDLKTKNLSIDQGTVFVTKVGLRVDPKDMEGKSIIVFPQKKRRRLHGIIKSYIATPFQNDSPEVIRGLAAEFLYYYKNVEVRTKIDEKTFLLCKQFDEASHKYRKKYKGKSKN